MAGVARVVFVLSAVIGCTRGAVGPGADATAPSPAKAVADWAAAHPKGWTLHLREDDPKKGWKHTEWSSACSAPPPPMGTAQSMATLPPDTTPRSMTLRYETADTEIDMGFRCPLAAPITTASLQAALFYVALHKLPHGISLPHWRFEVSTPVSSFLDGVTFTGLRDGRLQVDVETPLYAVGGVDTRPECEGPADSGMRPECFVHLEHRIPLSLEMDISFDPAIAR